MGPFDQYAGDAYTGVIYTFAVFGPQANNLVWQKFTGSGTLASGSGNAILTNLPAMRQMFAGSNGVFYSVDNDGQLYWYRDLANDGSAQLDPKSGTVISVKGQDFSGYNYVIGGGDGVIYAVDMNYQLVWFKDCANDGTPGWWAQNSGAVLQPGLGPPQLQSPAICPLGDGVLLYLGNSGMIWNQDCMNDGSNVYNQGQPISGFDPQTGTVIFPSVPDTLWGGNYGTFYWIDPSGNLNISQFSRNYDGTFNRTDVQLWSAAQIQADPNGLFSGNGWFHFSPLMPFNAGKQILTLAHEASTSPTPYPVFSGSQLACYNQINSQVGELYGASNFDVRSAYADPQAYSPDTLHTNVAAAKQPKTVTKADWNTVMDELMTETTQLSVLYSYQNSASIAANALATVYGQSFGTAQSTVSKNNDCLMSIFSAASFLSFPLGDGEALEIGMAIGIVTNLIAAGQGDTLSGPFDSLNFSKMITDLLDSALPIYAKNQPDWGKVMRVNQILQNAPALSGSTDTYQIAGDAYEVSLYVAYCASNMAIVSTSGLDEWGACGDGSGSGLAYPPTGEGMNGGNSTLCSRLNTLGVVASNLINGQGGWAAVPRWQCVKFQGNWTCSQTS